MKNTESSMYLAHSTTVSIARIKAGICASTLRAMTPLMIESVCFQPVRLFHSPATIRAVMARSVPTVRPSWVFEC